VSFRKGWRAGFIALVATAMLFVLAGCEPAPEALTKEQAAEAARQYLIASGSPGTDDMDVSSWTSIELYDTPENKCLDRTERELFTEFSEKFREIYREADEDPDHWVHQMERDRQDWREANPDLVWHDADVSRRLKASLSGRYYYTLLYVPGDNDMFGHIACMYVDQKTGEVILPEVFFFDDASSP